MNERIPHDLNFIHVAIRIAFSCAITVIVAVSAFIAIRWMAGTGIRL
jgi:hypothetical protein